MGLSRSVVQFFSRTKVGRISADIQMELAPKVMLPILD